MKRLYNCHIPIIALTGSIATGKSTVSNILKEKYQVIDADLLVKKAYKTKEIRNWLKTNCPEVISTSEINFKKLREIFFNNHQKKSELEFLIYKELPSLFTLEIKKDNEFIIYDIPLLFEKNLENKVDTNILIYCSQEIQIKRLLKRDQITKDLMKKILRNQINIEEKRKKAKHVFDNSKDLTEYKPKEFEEKIISFLEKIIKEELCFN